MVVKIKQMTLSFFKGVKNATYSFADLTNVYGQNGTGKSTIATAFYWLFADKSVELVSNPPIRPNDMEECVPRVEVVLDVDGKEVIVAKFQKQKVKEDKEKGTRTVSLTNSYEINAVEKSKRDFDLYLADLGIDLNKLLMLSHPDVFTSGMNVKKDMEQMRKTLLDMEKSYTDIEVADMLNVPETRQLLNNYTVEEIEAMQNSTIRKIRENYGTDGEILRAQIQGKEELKVDIDVSELELGKNALKEKIADNQAKQNDIDKQYEEYRNISAEIIELKTKQNDIQLKANESLVETKNQLDKEMANAQSQLNNLEFNIHQYSRQIESLDKEMAEKKVEIQKLRDELTVAKERKFDETSLVCPYCKQEYPADKKEQIKADFVKQKVKECQSITAKGTALRDLIKAISEKNGTTKLAKADAEKQVVELNNKIKELQAKFDKLPTYVDVSNNEEFKALQLQIEQKQAIYDKGFNADEIRATLSAEEQDLRNQLLETERKIASAEQNVRIDEQIIELREKQKQYEQEKANAEKILEQLKLISRKKNELLVDGVNSHFELVKWQLFDFQKNGDYKEVCIPTIDGRKFGESTNTGREVLAKLDIIKGLQNFYGQSYPVFVDGAENISQLTRMRTSMDCQMIYLSVPNIPEMPLLDRVLTPEERKRLIEEWQETKKRFEEYYKELRIEV